MEPEFMGAEYSRRESSSQNGPSHAPKMEQESRVHLVIKTAAIIDKMRHEGIPGEVIDAFVNLFGKVERDSASRIPESAILPVSGRELRDYSQLEQYRAAGMAALSKTAVIKLNGGMGTTMGLHEPKSLIEAKNGLSFLDITIRQILYLRDHGVPGMPLLLMNSFFTDAAIRRVIAAVSGLPPDVGQSFTQHKYPKLLPDSLEPVSRLHEPALEWNPAGHGDLFLSLHVSGILEQLRSKGVEFLFVSNIDNLGATIDPLILGYMAGERLDFLMEVTNRTIMDRKGGHLARLKNGRLALREAAQCAGNDADSFSDITRHSFFNTNNIWICLDSISEFIAGKKYLDLPPVISRKKLIPEDPDSPSVLHIESALGSAISLFKNSSAIRVPRTRFAPVKHCDDLVLVWSDYYILSPDFTLAINPARQSGPISITLDSRYYSRLDLLKSRFPCGVPSLADCTSLTITGDVRFGCSTAIRGAVSITNKNAAQAFIEDNADISTDRRL